MSIKDKIKYLKAQRKALGNTNAPETKKNLDKQITDAELEKINQQKAKKEQEKKELVAEAHSIVVKTYGTLKRFGLIGTKWDMSDLFNRSRSYFLVFESRKNQPLAFEDLKALKGNIQEIRYNLNLLLQDEDEVYKEWVRRKLDDILEDVERLEIKTLGVLYEIKY